MPKTQINPVSNTPSRGRRRTQDTEPTIIDLPVSTVPTNPDVQQAYTSISELLPTLNLPDQIQLELPPIADLAQKAIASPENGFAPSPDLPRVTDADREVHQVVYKEQLNAAHNLQDSIKVSTAYVDAATLATKLGKSVLQYATGLEGIREQGVKLRQAQVKTEIAGQNLQALQSELGYLSQENVQREVLFTSKLDQWQERVRQEQLKAVELKNTIDVKYAHVIKPQ